MSESSLRARALWTLLVFAPAVSASCGRIGFDFLERDTVDGGDSDSLALTLPVDNLNLNSKVMLSATGGTGDYQFSVVYGEGQVAPDSGEFTAPNYAGETIVQVTDEAGDTADLKVVAGGTTLFAMGGWGGYTTDKVYRSTDGVAWTVDNLEISRGETVTVVFRDQMFMTGGWYSGSNISSVLTSTSGVTGTWSTAGDLPAPRGWGGAVVFKDRIIYAGGRSPSNWANPEVYASDDGVSWAQIGNLPEESTWGGLAVFRGSLWYLGGDHDGNGTTDTIYRSDDGVSWEIAPERLPAARAGGAIVYFQDALWYLGGANAGGGSEDQIWFSSDGRNWVDSGRQLPAALRNTASTVHDGKIWLTGGNSGGFVNTVYYSDNGLDWNQAADLPESLDRFSSVSFTPR